MSPLQMVMYYVNSPAVLMSMYVTSRVVFVGFFKLCSSTTESKLPPSVDNVLPFARPKTKFVA